MRLVEEGRWPGDLGLFFKRDDEELISQNPRPLPSGWKKEKSCGQSRFELRPGLREQR